MLAPHMAAAFTCEEGREPQRLRSPTLIRGALSRRSGQCFTNGLCACSGNGSVGVDGTARVDPTFRSHVVQARGGDKEKLMSGCDGARVSFDSGARYTYIQ